jgi:arginase family enzyme
MEIGVVDRTPFIERILDQLACVPLTEAGRAVIPRFTPGTPEVRGHVLLCSDLEGQVVGPLSESLRRDAACSILVVSARSHCDARGTLRSLLAGRALDPRQLALFGMHDWSVEERAFLQTNRTQIYSMLEISREDLRESTDAVMMFVRTWKSFLLIVDLDVLDPAFVPGVSSAVPGGMTARELLYVVQRLALIPSLAGSIIVADGEQSPAPAAPSASGADAAARLCACIVAELAARG